MTNTRHNTTDAFPLWDGQYKIPWNDPEFSARILREHLSQDHHLASRKRFAIQAQAAWIQSRYLSGDTASILDLGCGPGLYSELLAGDEHDYLGIDFSPASIDYARKHHARHEWYSFVEDDVTTADFGGPHNLAVILYGEINVFPPNDCRRILKKTCDALVSGGVLVLEAQRFDTVKEVGLAPATKTEAEAGLFSDSPYVCLTENKWHDTEAVARQTFTVRADNNADSRTYTSTTKAWTDTELTTLLLDAGFSDVAVHEDWPDPAEVFVLLTARKK